MVSKPQVVFAGIMRKVTKVNYATALLEVTKARPGASYLLVIGFFPQS